ncbi:MAG TPA: hypothetical protein VF319_17765 [Caldimonas sp.]
MNLLERNPVVASLALAAAIAGAWPGATEAQPGAPYYQCPGNVFTNTISAKEAEARHCTAKEAKEPTTIAGPKPRAVSAPALASGPAAARVDPASQRARDSDARRILEDELKTEEERLAALRKEYNSGEPERQGDERNFQKYLDRTAELKAAVARKEADIAAIRRELAKLPK